jgi:hypothetical protein
VFWGLTTGSFSLWTRNPVGVLNSAGAFLKKAGSYSKYSCGHCRKAGACLTFSGSYSNFAGDYYQYPGGHSKIAGMNRQYSGAYLKMGGSCFVLPVLIISKPD